jgi:hypothetical protein
MTDEQTNLRYRRLAQLCVDMLANTSDPETRVALLEMAQTWRRLAKESETGAPIRRPTATADDPQND